MKIPSTLRGCLIAASLLTLLGLGFMSGEEQAEPVNQPGILVSGQTNAADVPPEGVWAQFTLTNRSWAWLQTVAPDDAVGWWLYGPDANPDWIVVDILFGGGLISCTNWNQALPLAPGRYDVFIYPQTATTNTSSVSAQLKTEAIIESDEPSARINATPPAGMFYVSGKTKQPTGTPIPQVPIVSATLNSDGTTTYRSVVTSGNDGFYGCIVPSGTILAAFKTEAGGDWFFSNRGMAAFSGQAIDFVGTFQPFYTIRGYVTQTNMQILGGGLQGVPILITSLDSMSVRPAQQIVTDATGSWRVTNCTSLAYKIEPQFFADSRGTWVFTPPMAIRGRADATNRADFTGWLRIMADGTVTDSRNGQGLSNVTVAFTTVSVSGPVPAPVVTDAQGNWSQEGFKGSTVYRATPALAGWVFTPLARGFTNSAHGVNFVGTPGSNAAPVLTYAVSGRWTNVNEYQALGIPGVAMTFTCTNANVSVPGPVSTDTNGNWSQSGFLVGASYVGAPSKPGWDFSANWSIRNTTTNRLSNFIGAGVSTVEAWDLRVCFTNGYRPSSNDLAGIYASFSLACNYLYDATDGMVRLRSVTFTNFSRTDWDNADIHWNTSGWSLVHVENGRKVMEMNPAVIFKTVHFTLVHELGHQRFGLADEYTSTNRCANTNHTPLNTTNLFSPNGHKLGDWVQRQNEGHTNLAASCTNCIMDQPDISEFCYRGNHNSSATNNSSGLPNWQQQASGKSCWESITATFPYLAISTNGPLPGPGAGPDTKTPLPSGASAALMVRIIPP